MTAKVSFKVSGGEPFDMEVEKSSSVLDLKKKCEEKVKLAPEDQRIIYKGKILKDDQILADLGVDDGHTIHLVKGPNLSFF